MEKDRPAARGVRVPDGKGPKDGPAHQGGPSWPTIPAAPRQPGRTRISRTVATTPNRTSKTSGGRAASCPLHARRGRGDLPVRAGRPGPLEDPHAAGPDRRARGEGRRRTHGNSGSTNTPSRSTPPSIKDIALDLAHALGSVQVARDALNPADQPQGAAEWNRYKDKGRMVGDQLLASIGLLNSHWHEDRGVIRAHALQARVMAEPDLHAPIGVYDWNAAWITGEIATRNPDPAQPLAVQPIRIPATKPEDIHLALPDDPANPLAGHGPSDHHAARRPRRDHGPAPDPRRGHADHAHRRHGPQRRRRPRPGPPGRRPREHVPGECERIHPPGAGDGPRLRSAPDEGPTGLWPAANMFPDPAVLPGAMPMETPDRPGPAQDAGMDGPAIGA